MAENVVTIVGAGLAGCEAAHFLAKHGIRVRLADIKPKKFTPAHSSEKLAELVCSNSLKSNDVFGNACGLLKEEMRRLGSLIIAAADATRVPAGGALAVDREAFSAFITDAIAQNKNIEYVCEEADRVPAGYAIVATGPLTQGALAEDIQKRLGGNLAFYDAAAPIVSAQSIDYAHSFVADRYGKGGGDYVNCPLTREEYEAFVEALTAAERAEQHAFDKRDVFEGCMPVEIMASRGKDTLRFGMLKPVGLYDENGKRPYAVLQLRKENLAGTAYNLVGFQTNLKFSEQKPVFSRAEKRGVSALRRDAPQHLSQRPAGAWARFIPQRGRKSFLCGADHGRGRVCGERGERPARGRFLRPETARRTANRLGRAHRMRRAFAAYFRPERRFSADERQLRRARTAA